MSSRIRRRDFATTAELEQPTIHRVQLYNAQLKRRLYAEDIKKMPEHRDHRAVAGVLSVEHMVEFMDLCRKVYKPALVTSYDVKKILPPAMRSMHEILFKLNLSDKQKQIVDAFADAYPDEYFEVLTALYGSKPEIVSKNTHATSSAR